MGWEERGSGQEGEREQSVREEPLRVWHEMSPNGFAGEERLQSSRINSLARVESRRVWFLCFLRLLATLLLTSLYLVLLESHSRSYRRQRRKLRVFISAAFRPDARSDCHHLSLLPFFAFPLSLPCLKCELHSPQLPGQTDRRPAPPSLPTSVIQAGDPRQGRRRSHRQRSLPWPD